MSIAARYLPIRDETRRRINLMDMDRPGLRDFFVSIGERPFRADQIMRRLYLDRCDDLTQMTELSKTLRDRLLDLTQIKLPRLVGESCSRDGSIKWLLEIGGGQKIESVYIPEKNRTTVCISSQVGCAMRCSFCSTGARGFIRNLSVSEIVGQLYLTSGRLRELGEKRSQIVTNVVIMGMGEPLLNLDNVMRSVRIMLDDLAFGISRHRIVLSTSGIVPAMRKLSLSQLGIPLALSLHAPSDDLRSEIMPINRKYGIRDLLSAARDYADRCRSSRKSVTIEYVMLRGVNDHLSCARQLAHLLRDIPCKVNLIPWNCYPGSRYSCSSDEQILLFAQTLAKHGMIVTVRKNRGADIGAACGQLSVGGSFARRPTSAIGSDLPDRSADTSPQPCDRTSRLLRSTPQDFRGKSGCAAEDRVEVRAEEISRAHGTPAVLRKIVTRRSVRDLHIRRGDRSFLPGEDVDLRKVAET